MGTADTHDKRLYDAASGVVIFLGMYQGLVPLLVRPIFDRDQRFAPALWLPSPWWWIVCVAIVLVALALLVLLRSAKQRRSPEPARSQPSEGSLQNKGTGGYDAASAAVFLVGIYNGIVPFVARLIFDGNQLLAIPLRLRAPWWWITSIAVVIVTILLLTSIDRAKQRWLAHD